MMLTILGTFYLAMVAAGYLIELIFAQPISFPTSATPRHGSADLLELHHVLNIVFLVMAALLVARFITSGGMPMVRMMVVSADPGRDQHHH